MNIGIDIDDTIVVTTKQMLKYADTYNNEMFGSSKLASKVGKLKDRYYLKSIYGWNDKIKNDFFEKYYKNILEECVFLDYVPEVLKKLKEEGNKLYFISARITGIKNCDTYSITKNMLESNNIEYDKIIFDGYDKLKYAKANKIDVFIDDIYDICKIMYQNRIKTFLMTSTMNENIDTRNIERVYDWNEVYKKINEYKKEAKMNG